MIYVPLSRQTTHPRILYDLRYGPSQQCPLCTDTECSEKPLIGDAAFTAAPKSDGAAAHDTVFRRSAVASHRRSAPQAADSTHPASRHLLTSPAPILWQHFQPPRCRRLGTCRRFGVGALNAPARGLCSAIAIARGLLRSTLHSSDSDHSRLRSHSPRECLHHRCPGPQPSYSWSNDKERQSISWIQLEYRMDLQKGQTCRFLFGCDMRSDTSVTCGEL